MDTNITGIRGSTRMRTRAVDGGTGAVTTSPNNGGATQSVDLSGALPIGVRESDVDGGAKVISKLQDHFVVVQVSRQGVSWIVSGQMAHVYLVGIGSPT